MNHHYQIIHISQISCFVVYTYTGRLVLTSDASTFLLLRFHGSQQSEIVQAKKQLFAPPQLQCAPPCYRSQLALTATRRNHCTGHFTPLLRTLSYQLLPPVTETYRTTIVACPPNYLHIFPNRSHVYLTLFKNFLHVKRIKVSPCSAKGIIWLLFIVGQSYIILNQFQSSSIF